MTSTPCRHEVELKYQVTDLAALQAFLDGPWTEALPDVALGDALVQPGRGPLLRYRREERSAGTASRPACGGAATPVTLTVKSLAAGGSDDQTACRHLDRDPLHRRIELEGPANARLDPDGWPSSPARELVDELRGAARLRALFTIRQRRAVRDIRAEDGTAQLSLDEVEVLVGRTVVGTFAELEIESTEGGSALLDRLATRLLGERYLVSPAVGRPRRSRHVGSWSGSSRRSGSADCHECPRPPA